MSAMDPGSVTRRPLSFERLPLSIRTQIYGHTGLVRCCSIDAGNETKRWIEVLRFRNLPPGSFEEAQQAQQFLCPYDLKTKFPGCAMLIEECVCLPLPIQLLRVSQKTYYDALQVLYSRNKFMLSPKTLACLAPAAFPLIKSLQVRLTSCSCVKDHWCSRLALWQDMDECDACHRHCKRGSGRPITLESYKGTPLIGQWQELCDIIRSRCNPRLNLTFICDCQNL